MFNFEEKMTDQFYSSIEELLTKVQKAQEHLRQATNILISVECIQKSIQENENENENEDENEMRMKKLLWLQLQLLIH